MRLTPRLCIRATQTSTPHATPTHPRPQLAEVQATFKSKIDRMAEQVRSAHRLTDDMVQRVKELEQENIKLKGDVVLRELPRRTEAETQLGVEGDGDVRVHVPAPSEDLRKVNAELEAQVQALRSDLEAAMAPDDGDAAMKAKLAHAASLLDAANAEIERLRADAERAGEDRDTAFRRAEDLRDALNATTAARDDAEARVGQADARVAHLEEDNALLRRQLNAAVARCKQLMSEADEKKSSGFKTRDFAHHVTLTKENQLLRAQVQSMKDERKRFMSKVRSGRLGT